LGVLGIGIFSTIGPTLMAALLSAAVWDYFFIPPRLTFIIHDPADFILILIYLLAAVILGYLTSRIRSHDRILLAREDRTHILYEISKDISASRNKNEFLTKINLRVGRLLDGKCGVILRSQDGKLMIDDHKVYSPQPHLTEKELAVAKWTFDSGKKA